MLRKPDLLPCEDAVTPLSPPRLVLELPPDQAFLPTAAAAAENAAQVFGLDRGDALRLALAVEEYFTYLCRFAGREEPIRLTLTQGGTFARASFRFRAGEVSLRALNFAASVDLDGADGEAGGEAAELGLLVASRTTDRSSLELSGADVYQLCAEVDRSYPVGQPVTSPQHLSPPLGIEETPGAGLLQHGALLAAGRYPARLCPQCFQRPARFADMVASDQYRALVALDNSGHPAGLLCWRASGRRGVVFSGPYVFAEPAQAALGADTARLLTERFLSLVARSEAVCAFSERPTRDLPKGWFERLGTLLLPGQDDSGQNSLGQDDSPAPAEQPAFFRHLREDVGGAVWAHPELMPFLQREYSRLAFSRDLLAAAPQAQSQLPAHSLLATALDRRRGMVVLRPLLDGRDFSANLAAHVAALNTQADESADDPALAILLHLDLSEPWQAARYPALVENGFTPRLILPHGGNSDILVCQHVHSPR